MEKSSSDYAHAAIKGVLSAVPIAGGPLSVFFETVFSAPIDKRKEEWLLSLEQAVKNLTEKDANITVESLRDNDAFISIAMQATQIAIRNHQREKLEALKNAVINAARFESLDENKALIFTRLIDELTPLHIKVLSFLDNPGPFEKLLQEKAGKNTFVHYPGNINIWEETYPDLRSSNSLIEIIVKELHSKGFVYHDNMHIGKGRVTTNHGREFLHFIQNQT